MYRMRFILRNKAADGSAGGGAAGGDAGGEAAAAAAAAAAGGGAEGDAAAAGGSQGENGTDAAGLLADAQKRAAAAKETPEAKAAREASEAAAKAGTRPPDLPEQFWDDKTKAPRIEAIVKSWKDTNTELKALKSAKGAPPAKADDYTFERPKDLPAHLLKDPATDADLKVLRGAAHAAKLTQAQFSILATDYFAKAAEMVQPPIDPIEELKKLGENGTAVADTVFSWVDGLKAQDVLSQAEVDEIVSLGSTADGMRALNKLREHAGGQPIPIGAPVGATSYTAEELYAMVGTKEYASNPAERARVDKLFEQHFGTQPAGSSKAGVGVR